MVNVKDYTAVPAEDKLQAIFKQQRLLMEKYHEIEHMTTGAIIPTPPLNLHLMTHQLRLKDFAWRVTEELGEALEAVPDWAHVEEEISDALHFLTELSILAAYPLDSGACTLESLFNAANDLMGPSKTAFREQNQVCLTYRAGVVMMHLSRAMNCLKNKPWKQTHMITDTAHFYNCIAETWMAFFQLCIVAGIDAVKLYDLYSRKKQVNEFRQGSNY